MGFAIMLPDDEQRRSEMKRLFVFSACMALAGCWTFEQCEYPKTALTSAAEGSDVSVRLSGFEATVTTYDSAYSYTTVSEPYPYRDRHGRYHHAWGTSTYRTETLIPHTSPTRVFLDRATESMEKAGFVTRSPNPRFGVEVKFDGPFSEDGDNASMVCWTLFTLFTAERGIQNWGARLKIYDLATGKLLMEHSYAERYQATVWGPVPFTAIMGTDATSPGKMKGWCLSALTDRAIADATAFLAGRH